MADHRGGRQDRPVLDGLHRQRVRRPDRPHVPDRLRGAGWGDAGITLAILGTTLGVSGILGSGTPEQIAEWVPQCFGTADDHPRRRVRGERGRRRLRRVVAAHARRLRRGEGRVGDQRHQDVDHQRRHHARAVHARRRRRGRARAEEPRPRVVRRPAGHARCRAWARSSRRWASAQSTPPRSCSTTCACPGTCLLGGKEKLDARLARAREGKSSRGAGRDEHVRGAAARWSARRRSASRVPRTSTRSSTPSSARRSVGRSS